MRTWYGLEFNVTLLDYTWCIIGVLPPHPQLVNMIIRRGLKKEDSAHLQLLHELGHAQAAPLILLYIGLLYYFSVPLPVAVSLFILWEVLAEAYVVYREGRNYITIYRS